MIIGEELGDILGLEIPSQVTVEDVIPYVDDELAKKFRSLRDGIRRQSCELRAQNRLGEMLHGQVFEHVEVYLSPGTRAWVDTTENLEQDRIEQGDSFEADF